MLAKLIDDKLARQIGYLVVEDENMLEVCLHAFEKRRQEIMETYKHSEEPTAFEIARKKRQTDMWCGVKVI